MKAGGGGPGPGVGVGAGEMGADPGGRLRGGRARRGRANANGARREAARRESAALGARGGLRALPVVLCSHPESMNHLDFYFTPDIALEAKPPIFRH